MEYHKAIVPFAPGDLTFEMVSLLLQLPAPFDLAKEIWPPAKRCEETEEAYNKQLQGEKGEFASD